MIGLLFSRSRPQQGLIWVKYDSFNYIFWTADPSATKLSMVMHHHESDCLPKDWFAVFKVMVTVKDHMIKIQLFYVIWTTAPFATKLSFMAHHHKLNCLVKRFDCSVVVKVKVTERLTIPVNVHVDGIFSTAEFFVTKLGMVMHHHRPECHARRLVCCLHVQGQVEGLYNQVWLCLPHLLNCWSFWNQI